MLRYIIGAVAGGLVGYFVLFRLIGCSNRSCSIMANPYISTILGIVMGLLIVVTFAVPAKNDVDDTSKVEYKRITAVEAKSRIDSGDELIILDVRTQAEYNAEHIPNAVLIPNETITDKMPELLPDFDAEILIYCRSGNRSAQAARKLIQIGYTNVYDFGGINNWPYDTVKE